MNAYIRAIQARDRQASVRLLRMAAASLLVHGLIVFTVVAAGRRSLASSFREKSILVTFRDAPRPNPGRAISPAVAPPLPAPAKTVSIPTPPAKPSIPAPAKPLGKEKVIPKDPTKAEVKTGREGVQISSKERAGMDAALEKIRRQVATSEQGAEEAEWNAAMAEVESNLQSRAFHQQAGQILAEAWAPPRGIPDQAHLAVRVLVRVRQDGTIIGYEIIARSGHPGLDDSVVRLFQKVKKLTPVPWALPGETFTLGYEFKPGTGGL